MRELDKKNFKIFQIDSECENEDNIPEVPVLSKKREYASDPGPCSAVTDSDSSNDIFQKRSVYSFEK